MAWTLAQDPLCCTSEESMLPAAQAVAGHDNQINFGLFGVAEDFRRGLSPEYLRVARTYFQGNLLAKSFQFLLHLCSHQMGNPDPVHFYVRRDFKLRDFPRFLINMEDVKGCPVLFREICGKGKGSLGILRKVSTEEDVFIAYHIVLLFRITA